MSTSTDILNARLTSEAGSVKLRRVFLVLLAYKLVYLLTISAAISIWPENTNADMFHSDRQVSTPDGYLTFDCHFASWDAEHYLFIAAHGYEAGAGRCGFFPLFPLTIRYFSIVTGGSQLVAGIILANMFSLAGWLFLFSIVCQRFGKSTAKLAMILMLAFPGSLFFQFIYTESLFFLLVMLLLHGLQENHFWLSLAAAFLLPLTRAVGLFCIFPVFWHVITNAPPAWLERLKSHIPWGRGSVWVPGSTQTMASHLGANSIKPLGHRTVWLLLAPICGWAVYLLLMRKWTGNAFEAFEAQKQFGVQGIGNVFNISHFVDELARPSNFYGAFVSSLDRCSFILLIYSLPIIWFLDKGWFLWSFFLGVLPAMITMFGSYTRYVSVAFPLFVAMAVFLNKPGPLFRCLRLVTVATFVIIQIILVWRFVNYRWAG